MHVAAVTPLYPPKSLVGAWLATHEYLSALVQAGHTVTVVPSLAKSEPGYTLDGVQVLPGVKHLVDVVKSGDVVVSHFGDQGTAHDLAVQRGIPSVRIVHGLAGETQLKRLKVRPPSLLVWNSEASLRAAKWDGPSLVARPVLEPSRFVTTPGDRVTQVNLSDAKGGQMFSKLVRFMPDVRFLGVRGGYGKQRDLYGHNVDVIQPTSRMRDVYRQTRVVVMPSLHETWGMVGPEAMCSGIPVVAAPTPGLRESLGSAGMFVELRDFGGWLAAVRSLVDDESAWSVASERALRRAEELVAQDDRPRFVEALEGLL